ncbi:hypothetical protein AB1Y20_011522 [Prymnesium parvum]|uniref:Methyltransferase small domain-containing protein n=1 Tax=Prymnesium parvum TaxID=97485 RepID=A0AB34IGL8_PRYPA
MLDARTCDQLASFVLAAPPGELRAPQACDALYRLARLAQHEPPRAGGPCALALRSLEASVRAGLGALGAKEVSKAAWGLARLAAAVQPADRPAVHRLLAAVGEAAAGGGRMDARGVAALLHAHAAAGLAPRHATLRAIVAHVGALVREFKSQDLANSLWAFAKLGSSPEPSVMHALSLQLTAQLPHFQPMELSSTAWALAKLDPPPAGLAEMMRGVHARLVSDLPADGRGTGGEQSLVRRLSAQGVANCLWAFSRVEPPPPPRLLQALLDSALALSHSLTPQGISNSCSACARLDSGLQVPLALLNARGAIASLSPQESDLGEVSWAVAKLTLPLGARGAAPPLLRAVAEALLSRAAAIAGRLDWQAAAHVDFLLRRAEKLFPASGGEAPSLRAAAAKLSPLLSAAVASSILEVQQQRLDLDHAAAAALLEIHPLPWAALPPKSPVLLIGGTAAISKAHTLSRRRSTLLPPHHPRSTASAPPVLRAAERGYSLVLLRLPSTTEALDLASHAAAECAASGAPLLVFGTRKEGILTAPSRLPAALFSVARAAEGEEGVVRAVRKAAAAPRGAHGARAEAFVRRWEAREALDLSEAGVVAPPLLWVVLPGLFAGGKLDVMTAVLLRALPPFPPCCRVMDFCCGAGSIAAALRLLPGGSAHKFHLLDADAVALHAARQNVPDARYWLSDGWDDLPAQKKFDRIVSNPPVHNGLQTDFKVVSNLIGGALKRLRRAGELWLVCQGYVPVGRMLQMHPKLIDARAAFDDGRFTVWTARRANERGGAGESHVAPSAAARTDEPMDGSCAVTSRATAVPVDIEAQEPPVLRKLAPCKSGAKRKRKARAAATADQSHQDVRAKEPPTSRGSTHVQGGPSDNVSHVYAKRACDRSLSKAQRKRARRKEQNSVQPS